MQPPNEFQRLRLAYDLYGFAHITNALEDWQVDAMEDQFDDYYRRATGFAPEDAPERLPPLGHILEKDIEMLRLVSSSEYLLRCLDVIAGCDCQYLGSDILCVYDDSIGPHRDTLYNFDTPKILIFLSDCAPANSGVPSHYYARSFAGSFAVKSGTHYPGNPYNHFAAQLTDWPGLSESVRVDMTPRYMRGDTRANGDYLYPFLDYDSRYQGYSFIPFKRGDVVIFSTRALHALLPTYSQHCAKLVGVLFIEGFSKAFGKQIPDDTAAMSDEELAYLSLPYNLRLADAITKGVDYQTALQTLGDFPMGLRDQLKHNDPLVKAAFQHRTSIYRKADSSFELIRERVLSSHDIVMHAFHDNFSQQRQALAIYYDQIPADQLLLDGQPHVDKQELVGVLRAEWACKPMRQRPSDATSHPSPWSLRLRSAKLRAKQKLKSLLGRH